MLALHGLITQLTNKLPLCILLVYFVMVRRERSFFFFSVIILVIYWVLFLNPEVWRQGILKVNDLIEAMFSFLSTVTYTDWLVPGPKLSGSSRAEDGRGTCPVPWDFPFHYSPQILAWGLWGLSYSSCDEATWGLTITSRMHPLCYNLQLCNDLLLIMFH